jgi:hypothetical protein
MLARIRFAVIAFALSAAAAHAQAPEPSDAAKGMVGAWEISNAARDKTCPLNFQLDAVTGGFKLELDEACGTAFPSLKDVTVWAMGPNDAVRLFNSKGAIVLDFTEVESHMYEAERKGEGSFHAYPGRHQGRHGEPEQVLANGPCSGNSRSRVQAHAVERLRRWGKLQDHGEARMRCLGRRARSLDLAV